MRTCLGFLIFLLAGAPLFSLEWELIPVTSLQLGKLASPPTTFSEELLGSLKVPFDTRGGGWNVKAHALAGTSSAAVADFDVLSATLAFQTPWFRSFKPTFGRFALSEPTGLILNHPGDGMKLDLAWGDVTLSLAEAYTGLVTRASSGVSMSLEDQARSKETLASPRLVGLAETQFPLVGDHRLTAGVLAQHDLNPASDFVSPDTNVYSSARGGLVDTQYYTLKVAGPIVERVFYEVFATYGGGTTLSWITDTSSATGFSYQYRPIVSFLGGGSVSYFRPEWFSSAFKARVLAASGDGSATSAVEGNVNPISTLFLPITSTTLGVAFSPALSNLIAWEFSGSVKPLPDQDLVTGVKLLGFQRAVAGVVNAPGVLSSGPDWLGTEVDLTATWVVKSDVQLSVALGDFVPTAGTYVSGSDGDGYQVAANFTLSLSF